jgi:hypothetical protein
MTREELFLMIIIIVFVLVAVFIIMPSTKRIQKIQSPRPRFTLPTDKKVYTFVLDSKLKPEEWEIILNAGWTFITCTPEQHKEYSCFGDPGYNKTYWYYVFQKQS